MWKEHTCNAIGDPSVVRGKNTHAMTLVDPNVVHDSNTHAMTLVDTYVVCGKNTHAMNSSGSILA